MKSLAGGTNRKARLAAPETMRRMKGANPRKAENAERRRLEQAVAAAEQALGESFFKEHSGRFWKAAQARPYLRARAALADFLMERARFPEAAGHYQDLMRLDPDDHLKCRYPLLSALGACRKFAQAAMLLDSFDRNSGNLEWPWMRALIAFSRKGRCEQSQRLLRLAVERNRFLPAFLLERASMPKRLPRDFIRGGRGEAAFCAPAVMAAWLAVPRAIRWLASVVGDAPSSEQRGQDAP